MSLKKPITGPREYFLELYTLFQAIHRAKLGDGVTYEIQDAAARVLSHLRNVQDEDVKKVVRAMLADHSTEESA